MAKYRLRRFTDNEDGIGEIEASGDGLAPGAIGQSALTEATLQADRAEAINAALPGIAAQKDRARRQNEAAVEFWRRRDGYGRTRFDGATGRAIIG